MRKPRKQREFDYIVMMDNVIEIKRFKYRKSAQKFIDNSLQSGMYSIKEVPATLGEEAPQRMAS